MKVLIGIIALIAIFFYGTSTVLLISNFELNNPFHHLMVGCLLTIFVGILNNSRKE